MDRRFLYFSPKKSDQIKPKHALYFLVLLLLSSFIAYYFICPSETRSLLRFAYIIVPRTTSLSDQSSLSPSSINNEGCDYTKGRWVWDDEDADVNRKFRYYDEGCPFLDPGFQCLANGRKDEGYLRWRWQPHGCRLPRFNATELLERSRNGRIVFAGDSLGRNQWESLLCMLSRSVSNLSTIYEVYGNPISKHKGYLSMRFANYNLTVEYYRAPFLVASGRAPPNSPTHVQGLVLVDQMHIYSRFWSDADVLVCNAGHWWNQDKTDKMGFYFQEKGALNMSMDAVEGFGRSIKTWQQWASEKIKRNKSHVFFRSYSPVHFRQGPWNEGGQCNESTEPQSDQSRIRPDPFYNEHISKAIGEMEGANWTKVHFLNITGLTEYRGDGHPSNHREPGTPENAPQDCSHWCLPGVPDTWNELLYAILIRDGYRIDRGETDTSSDQFAQSPFRIDVLEPGEVVQTPITVSKIRKLPGALRFSWIVVDPEGKRAANMSSKVVRKGPCSNSDLHVQFWSVLGGKKKTAMELVEFCKKVIFSKGEHRKLEVREVSILAADRDRKPLNGTESLQILEWNGFAGSKRIWRNRESVARRRLEVFWMHHLRGFRWG